MSFKKRSKQIMTLMLIGGSISKSSQVSKGVGGSMEYSIPAGKVGWVGVYAHGKRTVGQLRVEW